MRFKTTAGYTDLNNFPMEFATTVDGEPELIHGDAVVHFHVEIDSREYGIKEIVTHVTMIEMMIDAHELCIHQLSPSTINGDADDQWEVIEYVDLENKQIYPDRVVLDWETKTAEVYFA